MFNFTSCFTAIFVIISMFFFEKENKTSYSSPEHPIFLVILSKKLKPKLFIFYKHSNSKNKPSDISKAQFI